MAGNFGAFGGQRSVTVDRGISGYKAVWSCIIFESPVWLSVTDHETHLDPIVLAMSVRNFLQQKSQERIPGFL
jgi:hypothetical protein